MVNYKDVVSYKVYGNTQGWVKKMWIQNLERYGMRGYVEFDEDNNMAMVITSKINLKKINKTYERFRNKLDKAGKTPKAKITYILKDGREVSPQIVLFSKDFHKFQEYMRMEL